MSCRCHRCLRLRCSVFEQHDQELGDLKSARCLEHGPNVLSGESTTSRKCYSVVIAQISSNSVEPYLMDFILSTKHILTILTTSIDTCTVYLMEMKSSTCQAQPICGSVRQPHLALSIFQQQEASSGRTTPNEADTQPFDTIKPSPWPVCGVLLRAGIGWHTDFSAESKNSSQHNQSKKAHKNGYENLHPRSHTETEPPSPE